MLADLDDDDEEEDDEKQASSSDDSNVRQSSHSSFGRADIRALIQRLCPELS